MGEQCCAALVRVRPRFRRLLGSQTWLAVPAWVVGELDLPLSSRTLATKSVKDDFRRMRKGNLSFEVTRDVCRFREFYDHMYVPYAAQVYENCARIWSRDILEESFKTGELLFVTKEGKQIAGLLIRYAETGPRLLVFGVAEGNREYVREGALSALYHFSFRYLLARGFTNVWLGKSRAFLNDGVLKYKKKLGVRLTGASEGYFYLQVPKDTRVSRAFLKANPLIFEREGLLYGAVCADVNNGAFSEEDVERIDREFFMEGLSQIQIVPFEGACSATIPLKLKERIVIREISELLV